MTRPAVKRARRSREDASWNCSFFTRFPLGEGEEEEKKDEDWRIWRRLVPPRSTSSAPRKEKKKKKQKPLNTSFTRKKKGRRKGLSETHAAAAAGPRGGKKKKKVRTSIFASLMRKEREKKKGKPIPGSRPLCRRRKERPVAAGNALALGTAHDTIQKKREKKKEDDGERFSDRSCRITISLKKKKNNVTVAGMADRTRRREKGGCRGRVLVQGRFPMKKKKASWRWRRRRQRGGAEEEGYCGGGPCPSGGVAKGERKSRGRLRPARAEREKRKNGSR